MEALEDLSKSLQWNNKYIKGYIRRANLYLSLSDFENAKYDFQRVIDLEPTNREAKVGLEDAKKKEKLAKKKDYYKVLELDKTADEGKIRKAYKLLALKWHPDKNTENESKRAMAEKKFKEINEAYEVLSDPKKKQMFDNGMDPNDPESGGFGGFSGGGGGANPHDIFNMFFGGGGFPGGHDEDDGGHGHGGFGGGGMPGGFSQFFTSSGAGGRSGGNRNQTFTFTFK